MLFCPDASPGASRQPPLHRACLLLLLSWTLGNGALEAGVSTGSKASTNAQDSTLLRLMPSQHLRPCPHPDPGPPEPPPVDDEVLVQVLETPQHLQHDALDLSRGPGGQGGPCRAPMCWTRTRQEPSGPTLAPGPPRRALACSPEGWPGPAHSSPSPGRCWKKQGEHAGHLNLLGGGGGELAEGGAGRAGQNAHLSRWFPTTTSFSSTIFGWRRRRSSVISRRLLMGTPATGHAQQAHRRQDPCTRPQRAPPSSQGPVLAQGCPSCVRCKAAALCTDRCEERAL